jgi:glyoxylase-like metal-dependent hydrolase (beta-lactamase superfamily II)
MMFDVKKLTGQLYLIRDKADCYSTLLVGEERALVWDTGSGIGDLKQVIRGITSLPLLVIVSHGHFDHIGGSAQFAQVYMDEKDRVILDGYDEETLGRWVRELCPSEAGCGTYFQTNHWENIKNLDFDRFDLGNLFCHIVSLPGHSMGSIGVYVPALKLLLSGDALTPVMCLNFSNHGTIQTQLETLERAYQLDFDYFLTSHHGKLMPKELLTQMMDCIRSSVGKKHHQYQYPKPPYSTGWFYLHSAKGEPVGLICADKPEYRKS